ncbi:Glycosyl transferase family 2 [Fictibacillus solisalsi]|uniref:Glycosyl transferase family 2 n=1 Tax=Fictibacillus solisalsi TaxID=459525 RepID=A0A1G9YIY0_9BACL|nr:glycosyltransferase [Fictibacillus solisalsi]SDN09047.1 Glycosyl transferase family 2 [Fictibacillus solisalsi]
MKFSVLMSVYFKENPYFLDQSINSIINQTIVPNEIVLVKDGILTEELNSIINKYIKKYPSLFKIIDFKENQGLGKALREGVKACSYEIIARMDTDDIAVKDRFQKQLSYLRDNIEIDLVGSYIEEFEDNINNVLAIKRVPIHHYDIYNYAKKRNPLNHMTVMYRKQAVLKAGNYKSFSWNEDYYLWVRMLVNSSKMYNLPEVLVHARTGNSMFERRGGKNYAQADIKLQIEYYKLGFINMKEFILNIILRTSIRFLPNKIRAFIYLKFLRSKSI